MSSTEFFLSNQGTLSSRTYNTCPSGIFYFTFSRHAELNGLKKKIKCKKAAKCKARNRKHGTLQNEIGYNHAFVSPDALETKIKYSKKTRRDKQLDNEVNEDILSVLSSSDAEKMYRNKTSRA